MIGGSDENLRAKEEEEEEEEEEGIVCSLIYERNVHNSAGS